MTEHRPFYHVCHATTGPTGQSPASPLIQHYTDGTVAPDSILLLPILVSPMHREQPSSCMQLVHLGNSNLGFCNARTSDACTCCMTPVCVCHSRFALVSFSDETGLDLGTREAILCETCLTLPAHMRYALHAFVVAINSPRDATNEITPYQAPQAAVPICQRGNCPWNASRRVTLQTTQEVAFPTALNGFIFPSRCTTFDLCSGCYHFNIRRDKAFQIISVAPLGWPDGEAVQS